MEFLPALAADAAGDPGLTFALALGAGVVAQALAHHLRLPGIVLFLAAGVILGPDLLNIIRPQTLGTGLEELVGLAVAVILFEGGLNLNVRRLRQQAKTIRRLVTVGAVITAAGGAVAARLILGWEWRIAIVFGTLVIVTGPTVITPLVRRIRITRRLQTILEAEGVLIDPIGAIIAVVTLEVLLAGTAEGAALGLLGIPSRLLVGLLLGVAGGFVIGFLLRGERLIPDNIQNVFTLALVLAFYAVSEAILPESGILAAPVAGLVVGNMQVRLHGELMEFKEELTIMLVGLLFVLLAADVRLAQVTQLGWPAVWTIAVLMFVVRPLNVAFCTARSDLSMRERSFIAWLGPRGIVAAAVASLFAQELEHAGIEGGPQLLAVVFLVIAVTVLVQGLTGGFIASLLHVRRRSNIGYAIVGANPLGRALGGALMESDHEVVLVDSNAQETTQAKEAGFNVIYANANDERTLLRADIEGRRGFMTLTGNEGVNLLIANHARELSRSPRTYVCVQRGAAGVQPAQVEKDGHAILFGRPIEIGQWVHALRTHTAEVHRWRFVGENDEAAAVALKGGDRADAHMLPLVVTRKRGAVPVDEKTTIRTGDVVTFVTLAEQTANVRARMQESGWVPDAPPEPAATVQTADAAPPES